LINLMGLPSKRLDEITVPSGLYPLLGNVGMMGLIFLVIGLMYTAAYFYFKEKEA
jgi:hypothetical protein